ncbi:TPA: ead/Ea22-like family protein [Klebsiella pneumoniae]
MTITLQAVNELIQSLESAGELSIREQKFLKLAKAYHQLAAENLTMNRLLTDISDNHVEYFSEGEGYMFAGVSLDYVSEINMYVSRDVNAENPFPATDRIVAGIKADGRVEGAHFVANRMLAAWDAGFIEDTAKNAADVARMILASTEFMADAPEGDFDRSFADGILEDIAKQLREGDGK